MKGVSLLKHFTRSLVDLNEKITGIEEMGELPLSVLIDGKVRNIGKIELRKYVFTIPDENGKLGPRDLHTLVCIPTIPDGEPFINEEDPLKNEAEYGKIGLGQARLRGLNYEIIDEIDLGS